MVSVTNLSKSYGSNRVLNSINLTFEPGKVHALLGPNGAGKSTLLGCLSGATRPDSGEIVIGGEPYTGFTPSTALASGTATIYQHFQLVGDLSVSENLFLGREKRSRFGMLDGKDQKAEAEALLASLGLHVDVRTQVSELSVGQQQIVEIARAVHREPSLLILDEPTAALSAEEVERLLSLVKYLAHDRGLAVIYVTHLLPEVLEVADTVTVIRDGDVYWTRPPHELELTDIIVAISPDTGLTSASERRQLGDVAATLESFTCGFTGPVDLEIQSGEIIGLFGLMGSGRTDLLETLAGVRKLKSGSLSVHGRQVSLQNPRSTAAQGIALVPSDRKQHALFADLTSQENLLMPFYSKLSPIVRKRLIENKAFARVANYVGLTPSDPGYEVGLLSGGNAQKVSVGRWLTGITNLNLLLLDEPTQGVDVGSRNELYVILRNFVAAEGKAVVFASSDAEETVVLADRIVVIHEGGVVDILTPPFDDNELVKRAHSARTRTRTGL